MSQLSQQLEVVRGFVAIGPVMMSTVREPRQGEAQLMQLHLRPEKNLLKHSRAEMTGADSAAASSAINSRSKSTARSSSVRLPKAAAYAGRTVRSTSGRVSVSRTEPAKPELCSARGRYPLR